MNTETSEKLLQYLVKHRHWSPFEHASATLEIETTRDIARQILRHRSFTFQEFSQRYANPQDMEDTFVTREARRQDEENRQNSIRLSDEFNEDVMLDTEWKHIQRNVIAAAKEAYDWALRNGIAKEQARVVLPEGCTKSRLYMTGTIRSWIHYVDLRSGNGTQLEHMEVARAVAQAISGIFPAIQEYIQEEPLEKM